MRRVDGDRLDVGLLRPRGRAEPRIPHELVARDRGQVERVRRGQFGGHEVAAPGIGRERVDLKPHDRIEVSEIGVADDDVVHQLTRLGVESVTSGARR